MFVSRGNILKVMNLLQSVALQNAAIVFKLPYFAKLPSAMFSKHLQSVSKLPTSVRSPCVYLTVC